MNNVSGVVEPGFSAGAITVNGAYTQGMAGKIEIEIGGLTPMTEHDQLNVSGVATLLGNIDVSLINGFVPAVGDTFDVVTFTSRAGAQPIVDIVGLPASLEMLVHFLPTMVRLEFSAIAGSADCNGDAAIDLLDAAAFAECMNGPSKLVDPPPIGTDCRCADVDFDDDVDLMDAARILNVFGAE